MQRDTKYYVNSQVHYDIFYLKMHEKILIEHGLDLDHHHRLIHVPIKIHYDLHFLACLSCRLFIIILSNFCGGP